MEDPKKFTIKIESILGGESEYDGFATSSQYQSSFGIDPDLPWYYLSATGPFPGTNKASGFIRPSHIWNRFKNDASTTEIRWMETNPKNNNLYMYDAAGSVFAMDAAFVTTGLGDLNDGGSATGNGQVYNDNYIYFSRDTTIARYGPLDGSPTFTDDYWTGTLGKTALTNTTYPTITNNGFKLPNHVLHRHNDGKVYIADVVGNRGYLHYISTTKTSVEGDTDNGSTYLAIALPYGMWPTAIESYGSDIAIALYEGMAVPQGVIQKPAKLAFWDTTSQNFNSIVDFPDPLITALKYDTVTGVLVAFSGQPNFLGTRISRFVGNYSFEQMNLVTDALPPLASAVELILSRIYFASGKSEETTPNSGSTAFYGSVWAIGSLVSKSARNLFHVMGSTSLAGSSVSSLKQFLGEGPMFLRPLFATGGHSSTRVESTLDSGATTLKSRWRSQVYRIGTRFKITSITFPTYWQKGQNPSVSIIPWVVVDGIASSRVALTDLDTNIRNSSERISEYKLGVTGTQEFFIEITWTGTATDAQPQTVGLPITIEVETYG